MTAPIALQLYSVRDALAQDFAGIVRRMADIGYAGVETAGFPGTTARDAARLFRELGLSVPSAHSPLPLGDKKTEVLDTAAELGCRYLVCPWLDHERHFKSTEQIKATCDLLNQASAVARENGLALAYHNHWAECQQVEGRYAYQVMLDYLEPEVLFELDVYWARTAGLDPVEVIAELGARAPLLHIKDGPAAMGQPMVAVGQGTLNIPAIVQAGEEHTEWLIVELDTCATDMLQAVEQSYRFLVEKGLGRGNKG